MNNNIKVITLGGVEEIGKNCYLIEYLDKILIVDFGIDFADEYEPGYTFTFPNIKYLENNKHKIIGLLVTHGHLDHWGAIPYFYERLGKPTIYSSAFTIEMIQNKFDELSSSNFSYKVVDKEIAIGPFQIYFVNVSHSIPNSTGIYIKTEKGGIFVSGDYKFDDTLSQKDSSDTQSLETVGLDQPILGMFESTNIFMEGKGTTELEVYNNLLDIVLMSPQKVIVSTFSSMIPRINTLIDIARKTKRKIVLMGKTLRKTFNIAVKLNYIKNYESILIDENDVGGFQENELIYLVTGSQAEENAVLNKLSLKSISEVSINKGDSVIISSSIIVNNSIAIQKLHDRFIELGANVYHIRSLDVHASGHAYREDMKKMIKIISAQNVMPIHGYKSYIYENINLLKDIGYANENILVPNNGSIFEYNGNKWIQTQIIEKYEEVLDGNIICKYDSELINNRIKLRDNGIIIINISNGKLTDIKQVGVVSENNEQAIMDKLKILINDSISDIHPNNKKGIIEIINSRVKSYISKKLGKESVVIITNC